MLELTEITYTHPDGHTETHACNNVDISDFQGILNKIKNESIKNFTTEWLHAVPAYIFSVEASSSGKYHPAVDLGNGGLKRHLINVAQMVIYLTEPECMREKFTEEEVDIMICAALLHDCLKSGWQADYNHNRNTLFDHPRLMANILRCENTMKTKLPKETVDLIADCVETHMGEWITDKHGNGEPLKKPETEMQKLVHLADYLASRRELSFVLNDTVYALDTQDVVTIKERIRVPAADIRLLENMLRASENGTPIEPKNGFTNRSDDEIKGIWKSIIKYKQATSKQLRYIELAKAMQANNN